MPKFTRKHEQYIEADINAFRGGNTEFAQAAPESHNVSSRTAKDALRKEYIGDDGHDSQPYNLFSSLRETGKRSPTKKPH
jgi:hypothetical protein